MPVANRVAGLEGFWVARSNVNGFGNGGAGEGHCDSEENSLEVHFDYGLVLVDGIDRMEVAGLLRYPDKGRVTRIFIPDLHHKST